MAKFNQDFLNRIKEIDIVELASELLKVKRTGKNYVTNCIWHDEKSPSLTFNSSHNTGKCYGCNIAVDTIQLYMQAKNVTFVDAVNELAAKYNIPVVMESGNIQALTNKRSAEVSSVTLLQNIIKGAMAQTSIPAQAEEAISKIKSRWEHITNVKPLYWPGAAGEKFVLGSNLTLDDAKQALIHMKCEIKSLSKPAIILAFFDSKNNPTGFIHQDGSIWSQNVKKPLVTTTGNSKLAAGKTVDVFFNLSDATPHLSSSSNMAFLNKEGIIDISTTTISILYSYADTIRFNLVGENQGKIKDIMTSFRDGDKFQIRFESEEPTGLLSYYSKLVSNRIITAMDAANHVDLDITDVVVKAIDNLKLDPKKQRITTSFLIHDILKNIDDGIQLIARKKNSPEAVTALYRMSEEARREEHRLNQSVTKSDSTSETITSPGVRTRI
ncbi:CHC2 zinc finger domain-containing protein [Aeromonas dhakensis]|uniref:CHC2 zinc finger domain-containing protein n=1 Tax=Aeromonas dhakensis TaxID=196024 RepID=UPI003986E82E